MEVIIWVMGIFIFYFILYHVIKSAVCNGIIEVRRVNDKPHVPDEAEGNSISKITCPSCGQRHDMDYPKCPFCDYQY